MVLAVTKWPTFHLAGDGDAPGLVSTTVGWVLPGKRAT